jgi:exo-beta-1,3-glucanase (GH17 family)
LCYSPFRDGQDPKQHIFPTIEQIRSDLVHQVKLVSSNIRTYGCDNVLAEIPAECDAAGLNCYLGGYISGDLAANEAAVSQLLAIASEGHPSVQGLIVGNEALKCNYVTPEQLIAYITEVQDATDLPVTTGEPWGIWLDHPALAAAVDYITINVHPYWDGIPVADAPAHVIQCWNEVRLAYPGKTVVIGETGWPTRGATNGAAVPGEENQRQFLAAFMALARQNEARYFAFSAFDEAWKVSEPGTEVEGSWGIWTSARTGKACLAEILAE